MKLFNKFIARGVVAAAMLFTSTVIGLSGTAQAAACIPDAGDSSISTPTFNQFCNAGFGVGNEQDFVRVRQNTNGDDKDNSGNDAYQNAVTSACNTGDKFDVWTYIHNDAASGFNDNGNGSSVAKDVKLALSAPIGATSNSFEFKSTVSASNAQSVTNTATVSCGDKQVTLSLVPSTVHIYSPQYGWKDLGDNYVNGTNPIGSPTPGSGIQYGCWEYRMVVVYQVTVTEKPAPSLGECKNIDATVDTKKRQVSVTAVHADVTNAQVVKTHIDWGDGATSDKLDTHTYAKDGTYRVVVTITVKFADGHTEDKTSDLCATTATFSTKVTPKPQPPVLPNTGTGAGMVAGIFAGVTLAGTAAYRYLLGRRFDS